VRAHDQTIVALAVNQTPYAEIARIVQMSYPGVHAAARRLDDKIAQTRELIANGHSTKAAVEQIMGQLNGAAAPPAPVASVTKPAANPATNPRPAPPPVEAEPPPPAAASPASPRITFAAPAEPQPRIYETPRLYDGRRLRQPPPKPPSTDWAAQGWKRFAKAIVDDDTEITVLAKAYDAAEDCFIWRRFEPCVWVGRGLDGVRAVSPTVDKDDAGLLDLGWHPVAWRLMDPVEPPPDNWR
jgi:hypothetical protein